MREQPKSLYREGLDVFKRFDSPEDYAEYLGTIKPYTYGGDSWAGGSHQDNINKLYKGDTTLVAQAEKTIEQMADEAVFSVGVPLMQSSVVGYVPNVPAGIIGHPKAMYNRVMSDTPNISAPLTIYVDVIVSAGVSHKELMNRGIAVLAFCLAMQAIRPVEVYTVQFLGGGRRAYGTVTKIANRPLDIARAAWMLTAPGYARQLAFSASYALGSPSGSWAWDQYPGSEYEGNLYEKSFRDMLGLQPEDIFLNGAFLHDKLCLTDPVAWVKDMIKKHTEAVV